MPADFPYREFEQRAFVPRDRPGDVDSVRKGLRLAFLEITDVFFDDRLERGHRLVPGHGAVAVRPFLGRGELLRILADGLAACFERQTNPLLGFAFELFEGPPLASMVGVGRRPGQGCAQRLFEHFPLKTLVQN